jgi:hypothetical protein
MSDQISAICATAAARYEALAGKHLDKALLSQMKSFESLEAVVSRENNTFQGFRESHRKVFHAMSVALGPITRILDTFGPDIGSAFPPSSIIFGAVKFLVDAAKGVSDKYDAIIRLFDALKDFAVRLEVYASQAISQRLQDKLSDLLLALIEVLALSRQEIKHGRMWTFGKSLFGANSQASDSWDKLQRLVDGERGLVGAETLTGVKGIAAVGADTLSEVKGVGLVGAETLTKVKGVAVAVSDLSRQIEALSLVQNAAKEGVSAQDASAGRYTEPLKAVLQPTSSSDQRFWTINRSRVAGTGDWIRKEQPFQSWTDRERAVLWIAGNPGSGKSYIASNLISYLVERYPQKVHDLSHTSVAFFFFKDDDNKTRSFAQALRDMAFQIAQNDAVYAKYLVTQLGSNDQLTSISGAWRYLFDDFFIQHPTSDSRAILVLDGQRHCRWPRRTSATSLARKVPDLR